MASAMPAVAVAPGRRRRPLGCEGEAAAAARAEHHDPVRGARPAAARARALHAHGGGADVTSTFDLEADGDATVMRWRTELRLAACSGSLPDRAARRSRGVRPTARSTRSHVVCDLGVALVDAEPRPVPGAREDLVRQLAGRPPPPRSAPGGPTASTCASISCRSSEMIDTSPTSSSSHSASRSISARVASRPAKMPKLTRTSIAGGSWSCTVNAIAGSSIVGTTHGALGARVRQRSRGCQRKPRIAAIRPITPQSANDADRARLATRCGGGAPSRRASAS